MNLASRLESSARPNQILILEDTYLLIRDTIHCEKLDRITVKNIKHPVQTYEVRGSAGAGEGCGSIDVHSEGFALMLDPNSVSGVEEERAILGRALALLEQLEDGER